MNCTECGEKIHKSYEDFSCTTFIIPFINLKLWRFDGRHHKCNEDIRRSVSTGRES